MLRVRTEVRPSSIHGQGLFAAERIVVGTVVWEFDPASWRTEDGYVTPGDDAKYINHSKTPNLSTTPGLTPVLAVRDIEVGEELTESYEYDLDWPTYSAKLV